MKKIAFIISAPGPQYEEQCMSRLREKYRPVFEELLQRGLEASLEAYDSEERMDWSQYCMLIPSPALEYSHNYQALLSWLASLETMEKSLVQNPTQVIRWNSHKSYLLALEQLGVNIPRTRLIKVGASREEIRLEVESLASPATSEIVAKPAVGASGVGTCKLNLTAGWQSAIEALSGDGDVLIQEFIPEILNLGEFSLIYFNTEFSHAVRKFNKTGDFRINSEMGGDSEELGRNDKYLEILQPFAEKVLQLCPYKDLLYARVDIALTGRDGGDLRPVLMELELFEPDVYVNSTQAVKAYVDAIESKLKCSVRKDKMSTENI